MLIKKFFKLKN